MEGAGGREGGQMPLPPAVLDLSSLCPFISLTGIFKNCNGACTILGISAATSQESRMEVTSEEVPRLSLSGADSSQAQLMS